MKIVKSLAERAGLDGLNYPVPSHANTLPYMLGGLIFFAFLIQAVSGIWLAQYYNPDPAQSYQSVIYIITQVPYGDFIRSLHFWTANLIFVILIAHLLRVFITGSYKRPRELTWYLGVLLLAVMFAFVFSGSVLKWDQEGMEALGHSKEVGEMFGIFGSYFNDNFSGSLSLLSRMYTLHINILVLAFIALVAGHFLLIKKHGISPKVTVQEIARSTEGEGGSKFSRHLVKLLGAGLLLLFVAGALALFFPAPLGHPSVPDTEVTKPWWMFYPFVALENFFDVPGMVWGGAVLFAFLLAVPLIDGGPYVSPRRRRLVIALGTIFLTIFVGLGIYAWLSPSKAHLEAARDNRQQTLLAPSAEPVNLNRHEPAAQLIVISFLLLLGGVSGSILLLIPHREGGEKLETGKNYSS